MSRWNVALAVIFLIAASLYGFRSMFLPAQDLQAGEDIRATVTVTEGASFGSVATQLADHGLIANRAAFVLLGKLRRLEDRIKAGRYDLHARMSPSAILDVLERGRSIPYRVTIPEGLGIYEIGVLLEREGIASSEAFVRAARDESLIRELEIDAETLEGFLFPDTYQFHYGALPREIVSAMVAQFQQRYTPDIQQQARDLNLNDLEVVTLASIIEKETGATEERALISAVFHNRLKRGIPLQSDPTVIYSLPEFDGNIRKRDLGYESPYNTYVVKGLPPGPITNPGWAAIRAAIQPADVPYLYFVSKNDGTHHFSTTLAEHQRAVYRYQKRTGRRTS